MTKNFGAVTALDQLSFVVQPGRVTGFLGPNGAGKTTTMRVVLGLDKPTAGTALVGGRRYQDLVWPLHEVGSLLDANAVHPGRPARDHLVSVAQANGVAKRRVEEVLDLTGLGTVADRRVRTYSLGMKQRLGIAGALLGDPAVLVFDEPVNGLDPEGVRPARELFRAFAAQGPHRPRVEPLDERDGPCCRPPGGHRPGPVARRHAHRPFRRVKHALLTSSYGLPAQASWQSCCGPGAPLWSAKRTGPLRSRALARPTSAS